MALTGKVLQQGGKDHVMLGSWQATFDNTAGRCPCRIITAASETDAEPHSTAIAQATHVNMACEDNVHTMLKEKVLQHHSQAAPVRRRTALSGACQRQHNTLCAFQSCLTSCKQDGVHIQKLLGGVTFQVTALYSMGRSRECSTLRSTQQGKGRYLLSRA